MLLTYLITYLLTYLLTTTALQWILQVNRPFLLQHHVQWIFRSFYSFLVLRHFEGRKKTVLSQDHHQKAIVLMILLFRTFDSFGV